jgi:riboflavin biosynthesis pyrimidine reductase
MDLPSLLSRHPLATPESQPLRLVFDPNGILSGSSMNVDHQALLDKTFCTQARSILLTNKDRNSFTDRVEEKGHLVLTLDAHDPFDFDAVLGLPDCKKFLKKPLGSILVEGGSSLLSPLIHRDHAVGGHTFLSPLFLGGSHWIGKGQSQPLSESSFMSLKQTRVLGRDVLIEWSKPYK